MPPSRAPLVFAGYGIAAPEYAYDDFKGVDVRGKVVMVLTHEPQEHDAKSRFKGRYNTVHAFNWWKPEVIRQHGAAAILIVQEKTPDRKTVAEAERPDQRTDSHRPRLARAHQPVLGPAVLHHLPPGRRRTAAAVREDDRSAAGRDRPDAASRIRWRCRTSRSICGAPSRTAR